MNIIQEELVDVEIGIGNWVDVLSTCSTEERRDLLFPRAKKFEGKSEESKRNRSL